MKKHIYFFSGITFIILLLLAAFSHALAPPKVIQAKNQTAEIIVVAQVVSIHPNEQPAFFLAQPRHFIKGNYPGETLKILFGYQPRQTNNNIKAHSQGIKPLKTSTGDIIVAYLNRSAIHSGCLTPLLAGSSVIRVYSTTSK